MSKSIDILERIHTAYYQLTVSERKVADFVFLCPEKVQYMSINQVAEECGVADATVSRFCRNLGLNGFHSFKLEIAKHVATISAMTMHSSEDNSNIAEITTNESGRLPRMLSSKRLIWLNRQISQKLYQ